MIDTKELRRLVQAATPGPWIAAGPSFGESLPKYLNEVVVDREGDEDDCYSICGASIGLDKEGSDDMAFIAAVNPSAISELLDRLEAAEKSDAESLAMYRKARDERDAYKTAFEEWHQKTGWVQQGINDGSIPPTYLGWHRADVMTDMLKSARRDYCVLEGYYTELAAKLEAAEKAVTEAYQRGYATGQEEIEKRCDVLRDRLALESQENGALRESVDRACEERDWNAERLEDAIEELTALRAEVESWKGLAQQFGKEADALRAENETLAANLRVPDAVMAALDNLDDYIARIEGDDRGACNHINLLRRYLVDATEVGENK